jgi:hypothetical protein
LEEIQSGARYIEQLEVGEIKRALDDHENNVPLPVRFDYSLDLGAGIPYPEDADEGLSPDDIYVLDQVGKVALDSPGYFLRRFELVGAGEFQVHFTIPPVSVVGVIGYLLLYRTPPTMATIAPRMVPAVCFQPNPS